MAITDWPADERPREKLVANGAASLSDAELLAIFLRTGIVGVSAVDLARQMLAHFGSLNALIAAPLAQFCQIKGMGEAKFAQLQATVELARRALGEQLKARPVFDQPQVLHDYLRLKLSGLAHEAFYVLLLGSDESLIKEITLFRGNERATVVHPKEVAKLALIHSASAVVVAHNHPQGDATPSTADIATTNALKKALALIDVALLDHVIVAGDHSASLQALGLL
jgi:DNA repair protein RadC